MSAGEIVPTFVAPGKGGMYPGEPPLVVYRSLSLLAPKMRDAVNATLIDCHHAGLDAIVFETYRSHETAVWYWRRGRTTIPPHATVTNSPDETWSWHGYGLAVDIVSESREWGATPLWFRRMAAIGKSHGLAWGGDWLHPDTPHLQWGRCRATPSDTARTLLHGPGGLKSVWRVVLAA